MSPVPPPRTRKRPEPRVQGVSYVPTEDIRAHGRIRTCDARFRKPTLYPLSYAGGEEQAYPEP